MSSNIFIARTVGALFLIVMATYTLGAVFLIDPILSSPDYLVQFSGNRTEVTVGVIFELINGIAYIGIAVLMYPILKQVNDSVANWYLGFRVVEFTMQILSDFGPLLLITLSQEFVAAGSQDTSSFQPLGALLLAERYWASQMVFITYALGALVFYYALYRLKLVPKFLSIWGLIGAPLVLVNVMLEIFGYNPGLLLGAQMGLNEIVLGFWLIAKGFR